MKINIKGTNLDLTPSLKTYIDEKLGGLAKFIKRFDEDGVAELWLEVGRTTAHHHKGEVFSAEADLRLPKEILRASHADKDVRTAIDIIRDKIHQEILKYKTRIGRRPKRQE